MKTRVGIIGKGHVGSALERGLKKAGWEVRTTGNDAKAVRETGAWAELIILAVPFRALDDTLRELGDTVHGKTVIDASNALDQNRKLALGFTTSGAEELQKKARDARIVKCFNTVFAIHMDSGRVKDQQLTAFVAGDHKAARDQVLELARAIGFDAVDSGPLENARWLESIGYLNIQMAFALGHGPQTGFKYIH